MMMLKRHPKADAMWSDPRKAAALNKQWKEEKSPVVKTAVAWAKELVPTPDTIVDLGCGTGRYAHLLPFEEYRGYDVHPEMIRLAKENVPENAVFAVRDVQAEGDGMEYDLALYLDVAMHHNMPLASALNVMRRWNAKRFIWNALVDDTQYDVGTSWTATRHNAMVFLGSLQVERRTVFPEGKREIWLVQSRWSEPRMVGALDASWRDETKGPYAQTIISWIKELKPETVVDLGCGTGERYARHLSFGKYWGYDIRPEMVRQAKEKGIENATFAVRDVLKKGLKRKYDLGLILDVVYHQKEAIDIVSKVMSLWDAERFLFDFLVDNANREPFEAFLKTLLVERKKVFAGPEQSIWLVQAKK